MESATAVERLRTFANRIRGGTWPAGMNTELAAQTAKAQELFTAALAEDLNTSEARAAIFDLVRAGNTAGDSGKLFDGNIPAIQEVLRRFDEVFAVLEDRDAEIARRSLQWAEEEGRGDHPERHLVLVSRLEQGPRQPRQQGRRRGDAGRHRDMIGRPKLAQSRQLTHRQLFDAGVFDQGDERDLKRLQLAHRKLDPAEDEMGLGMCGRCSVERVGGLTLHAAIDFRQPDQRPGDSGPALCRLRHT